MEVCSPDLQCINPRQLDLQVPQKALGRRGGISFGSSDSHVSLTKPRFEVRVCELNGNGGEGFDPHMFGDCVVLVGASQYSLIAISRGENVKIIDIFLSLKDPQYFIHFGQFTRYFEIYQYITCNLILLIGILSAKRILITVQLSIEEFCLIEVLLSIW